jgi:DUF971 family protein
VTGTPPPKSLKAIKQDKVFVIEWPDGKVYSIPFKLVRSECPCAQCIDEITGARILRPETISDDIAPKEIGYSGNYALKILWSDNHASGIYTWERLRWICEKSA